MDRKEAVTILQEKRDLARMLEAAEKSADWAAKDRVDSSSLRASQHGRYADALDMAISALSPPNEPLTQADLDSMDYDKVWIDYEDGTGEWALVCNGYIYSIDTLEGAGLDFVDYIRGERLEHHGYKAYRRPPEGEANA
ncbi:MAG: hypothetical protein ACLT1A_11595 [Dysosmobacter sp.]